MAVPPQADFFSRLQSDTRLLDDGTVTSRFTSRLALIRNDVAAARALISQQPPLSDQALDHLEAAARHLGEAVALVHDRKVVEGSSGYHYRAIALLRAYCRAFALQHAGDATQFETIRSVRNMLDYPDDHWPGDDETDALLQQYGPAQASLWLTVTERCVAGMIPILERDFAQRHPPG
jgi:hypothetical protein